MQVLGSEAGFGWVNADHVWVAAFFQELVYADAVDVVTHIFRQIKLLILKFLPFLPTLTQVWALRRIAPQFHFGFLGFATWRFWSLFFGFATWWFWSPFFWFWRLTAITTEALLILLFRLYFWNASSHVIVLGFAYWNFWFLVVKTGRQ